MTALAEVHAGESIPLYYHGPTVVYIIEGMYRWFGTIGILLNWTQYIGEIYLNDEAKSTKFNTGDVIHVDEGSSYSWYAPSYAKGK